MKKSAPSEMLYRILVQTEYKLIFFHTAIKRLPSKSKSPLKAAPSTEPFFVFLSKIQTGRNNTPLIG